jgi:hypothetical protein
MIKLQEDFLEIYNNLVELSDSVLGINSCPVAISWNQGMGCLEFSCKGKNLFLRTLNYYLIRPDQVPDTWLLPEDYDALMSGLNRIIKSGKLIQDRLCLVPSLDGFDLYQADTRNLTRGAQYLGTFRFISGRSKWFRWRTKNKYKKVL